MKPASILLLSLFFASSPTFAQNGSVFRISQNDSCPVHLRAQYLPDGDLIKTGIAHPKGIGQALHLILSNSTNGLVTEATILLRGWTPKGRRFETANEAKPDAVRSRHILLVPGPDQSAIADIWVPGLSAITSVEIVSATYTNGSSWAPSGNLSCGTVPDGFMPVHP